MRASPSGVPHPSSNLQLVELPKERAWPSAGQSAPECVSFGAPSDEQMSNAAPEGETSLSPEMMTRLHCPLRLLW